MSDGRYFVRREECWGGTHVWAIVDGQRKAKPIVKKTPMAARALCDRMNQDWLRYSWALACSPKSETK